MNRLSQVGLILLVVTTSQTICRADLEDGLVAYYAFDDGSGAVLEEATGNATDGDLYLFPDDDSQWVAGQIGGALEFDGIDDYVIVPECPLAETALSVSIWGYANEAPTWASLVKNWGGAVVGQFHFGLGPGGDDTLNIFVTTLSEGAFNAGTDPEDIELEVWQHFAFVADPDEETVRLYRDGTLVDERPYDGTFTDAPNSEALGIGVKTNDAGDQADPGAPGYWNGMLDDLGIWHRALSEDEIVQIYTDGLAGKPILGGVSVEGDYNNDGRLDAVDLDLQASQIVIDPGDLAYDLNDDSVVDFTDRQIWVNDLKGTWIGDANLDMEFNSSDMVQAFVRGKYETGEHAGWEDGDWNGDTQFGSGDMVAAFVAGGYEQGAKPAVVGVVPEPSSVVLVLMGLAGLWAAARRCSG